MNWNYCLGTFWLSIPNKHIINTSFNTPPPHTHTHTHRTKGLPFRRRYFQTHFLEGKFWFKLFLSVQLTISGHWFSSGNALALNIWTNVDPIHWHWRKYAALGRDVLTDWGRVTPICISKLTIIDSNNALSPDRSQAIIWTNAGILLIGPLETNFSGILFEYHTFSFKEMHLKMSF